MRRRPIFDKEIRSAMIQHASAADPEAALFHELNLSRCLRRADLIAVNGVISGYEIKSERDRLSRLEGQPQAYAGICE